MNVNLEAEDHPWRTKIISQVSGIVQSLETLVESSLNTFCERFRLQNRQAPREIWCSTVARIRP